MTPNILVLLGAAFIPVITGMIWYNPKVFGTTWCKELGITLEEMNANQKPVKFFFAYVLNVMIGLAVFFAVVHDAGLVGVVGGDLDLLRSGVGQEFMSEHGNKFNHFGHGMLHGVAPMSLFYIFPVLAHAALWSGRSLKFLLITWGYWVVTLALMGGVIAQWGCNAIV